METPLILLTLGALLLVGLVADEIGRRTRLPRVTLLILFGLAAGPSGFDILPDGFQAWYEFLATLALTMVAFLLGGQLSYSGLRENGREILWVSVAVVIATAAIVFSGLILIGAPLILALLLAGIATATDPAATKDVVRQARAKGPFTATLLGIVAIDDVWGLIAFSVLLVIAKAVAGDGGAAVIAHGAYEIGGAVAIGVAVGLPAAYFTGRLRPNEPIQSEALGVVFLCAGLATWAGVSFLLAGMVAGALVVNLAEHHSRAFHEIEHIEWPFMVFFFVLAGASLQVENLSGIGLIGGGYIILRIIARVAGGYWGGRLADAPASHRRWVGAALIPQAGVALGMALVAGSHFPELKEPLLALVIGATVFFELIGPALTQLSLTKVGERGDTRAEEE